jgi:predicted dehydrogenase
MNLSRRDLLKSACAGVAGISLPLLNPSRVLGANERLNIGVIGVAGRGGANLSGVSSENIVALCDVDKGRLGGASARFKAAKTYTDYRRMLEQPNLDAVVVSTPDHHHAPASIRAMRAGLHVYCEKPLTHTVAESRMMAQLAAEKKLATQMGTQNHEHPSYLRTVELLKSGTLGDVTEVHVITDRPGRWWKQGMAIPGETPPVPANLAWDLWLGPAETRAYHPAYVPFAWRGWWDFGCGAIGDMAIHLLDPAFWGLALGGKVKVTSTGPEPNAVSGPTWMITKFEFGQRGNLAPVTVYWYEGTAKPPAEIAGDLSMNGSLFLGEKGKLAVIHGGGPPIVTMYDDIEEKDLPEPFLPKSPGHHQQWIAACKTGSETGSNFGYAGPFTEFVLLGNVAYRSGETIEYDPATMKVTNSETANHYLSKEYRKGWEI